MLTSHWITTKHWLKRSGHNQSYKYIKNNHLHLINFSISLKYKKIALFWHMFTQLIQVLLFHDVMILRFATALRCIRLSWPIAIHRHYYENMQRPVVLWDLVVPMWTHPMHIRYQHQMKQCGPTAVPHHSADPCTPVTQSANLYNEHIIH